MFDQYLSCKSVPFLPEIPLWLAGSDSPWWSLEPGDLAQTPYADPYWAFCWPGGAALARFLLDQPHWAKDRWVYDIGTGCGVVALAAKKVGARAVVANDIDPWALRSTEKNAKLNQLSLEVDGENLIGKMLPAGSLVLFGDMLYAPDQSERIVEWCKDLQANSCDILLADPRRGYGLPDEEALAWIRVASEVDKGDGRYTSLVGIWLLRESSSLS